MADDPDKAELIPHIASPRDYIGERKAKRVLKVAKKQNQFNEAHNVLTYADRNRHNAQSYEGLRHPGRCTKHL
jgi:hypothetical protein